ncbi:MAG: hypothetical protein IJV07_04985 [Alphaproteobacteria bacterium]|nr:hypothetical protein [Alphaproteobacteria bacterium]
MIKNKIKTATRYAILSGMAVIGQIASTDALSSPQQGVNASKTASKAENPSKKYVYERDEGFMFEAPLLITPMEGMKMACAFSMMTDLQLVRNGRVEPVHVERITKMSAVGKQTILSGLISVKEMKSAWERINKYMKAKGIENFGAPSGQLPKAFREDVNGVLTTWVVDTKSKTTHEFSFDKDGREVPPDKVGNAKRFYRYHADTFNFLCARMADNGYLAIEIGQMEHPCPIFTYRDGKGINYVSLGGVAYIDDGKIIRAYRGTTQELQREQEMLKQPQKSR